MQHTKAEPDRNRARRLHPLPVRIMHWINAVAILIMISSGWKIYNDDVIFGWLHFPDSLALGQLGAERAAMAFFWHVDRGAERVGLRHLWFRHRALSPDAVCRSATRLAGGDQ